LKCPRALFGILFLALVELDSHNEFDLLAAAIGDDAGNLQRAGLDGDVRGDLDGIFHAHAYAPVGPVFQRRRRHARRLAYVHPQDIDPRHQRDSLLGALLAHALLIGKKPEKFSRSVLVSVPSVFSVVKSIGIEQRGTDYPFWRDDAFKLCVDYAGVSGLAASDVQRILGGNGQELLGLQKLKSCGVKKKGPVV